MVNTALRGKSKTKKNKLKQVTGGDRQTSESRALESKGSSTLHDHNSQIQSAVKMNLQEGMVDQSTPSSINEVKNGTVKQGRLSLPLVAVMN